MGGGASKAISKQSSAGVAAAARPELSAEATSPSSTGTLKALEQNLFGVRSRSHTPPGLGISLLGRGSPDTRVSPSPEANDAQQSTSKPMQGEEGTTSSAVTRTSPAVNESLIERFEHLDLNSTGGSVRSETGRESLASITLDSSFVTDRQHGRTRIERPSSARGPSISLDDDEAALPGPLPRRLPPVESCGVDAGEVDGRHAYPVWTISYPMPSSGIASCLAKLDAGEGAAEIQGAGAVAISSPHSLSLSSSLARSACSDDDAVRELLRETLIADELLAELDQTTRIVYEMPKSGVSAMRSPRCSPRCSRDELDTATTGATFAAGMGTDCEINGGTGRKGVHPLRVETGRSDGGFAAGEDSMKTHYELTPGSSASGWLSDIMAGRALLSPSRWPH